LRHAFLTTAIGFEVCDLFGTAVLKDRFLPQQLFLRYAFRTTAIGFETCEFFETTVLKHAALEVCAC